MSRPVFTDRQREVLRNRLARAICWAEVPGGYRTNAYAAADVVLSELEDSFLTAAAARRGVLKVIESTEERSA